VWGLELRVGIRASWVERPTTYTDTRFRQSCKVLRYLLTFVAT
jgi:hypothetical protein